MQDSYALTLVYSCTFFFFFMQRNCVYLRNIVRTHLLPSFFLVYLLLPIKFQFVNYTTCHNIPLQPFQSQVLRYQGVEKEIFGCIKDKTRVGDATLSVFARKKCIDCSKLAKTDRKGYYTLTERNARNFRNAIFAEKAKARTQDIFFPPPRTGRSRLRSICLCASCIRVFFLKRA